MPVQFLYPTMFIALAGLLLPLAIHLSNRRRGRIILFGSTQFLEATQRKKISQLSTLFIKFLIVLKEILKNVKKFIKQCTQLHPTFPFSASRLDDCLLCIAVSRVDSGEYDASPSAKKIELATDKSFIIRKK